MAITGRSTKLLWSNAAGLCAFPECRARLAMPRSTEYAAYIVGEMAHIAGDRLGSNRHDLSLSAVERDDYNNLILLCPTHHALIDRKENETWFPVQLLERMKSDHEEFVLSRLTPDKIDSREVMVRTLAPMLAANYQAWLNFGPYSDIAARNPHSESAYETWLLERLTTIVPNNRRISFVLQSSAAHLLPADQVPVAAFLQHARSYERWVADEISYEGVQRFPASFASMIESAENAST